MYLDVVASFHVGGALRTECCVVSSAHVPQEGLWQGAVPRIVGGRYGLGSKEFTPRRARPPARLPAEATVRASIHARPALRSHAAAVFDNMRLPSPKRHFTVGIEDDVAHTSLPITQTIHAVPAGTTECMFWALGADGTVGANKEVRLPHGYTALTGRLQAIKIIGENTNLNAQGYFSYDAHKSGSTRRSLAATAFVFTAACPSGGITVSHLRFGPKPITSQYMVQQADYIACHHPKYPEKYDMTSYLKPGGTFVLNATIKDPEKELPAAFLKGLAEKKARFFIIDAFDVSVKHGLGRRINMVRSDPRRSRIRLGGVVNSSAHARRSCNRCSSSCRKCCRRSRRSRC
jgi:pyruvate-ferredoxin/flavodoxin oxidoreductase